MIHEKKPSDVLENKTVIVTGGAGFIGSNFIRYLKRTAPSCKIICFDKLTYAASLDNISAVPPLCELVVGDITSENDIFGMLECYAPEFIVNFAAESHVDRSIAYPHLFYQTNTLGVLNLLDNILKYRDKTGKDIRFHQISTDEVYGDLPISPDGVYPRRFSESSRLSPSSPYAASKASADMLVMSYCRTYGLNAVITRSANNYGRYQHFEKLIPHTVMSALENKKIGIYGDGKNQREWLYVDDHCGALLNVLTCADAGEIYNIGSQIRLDNDTLVKMILRILGKSEDMIEYISDRKGHDRAYATNSSKYSARFGEIPNASNFETTLKNTVLWYAERAANN